MYHTHTVPHITASSFKSRTPIFSPENLKEKGRSSIHTLHMCDIRANSCTFFLHRCRGGRKVLSKQLRELVLNVCKSPSLMCLCELSAIQFLAILRRSRVHSTLSREKCRNISLWQRDRTSPFIRYNPRLPCV